MDAPGLCQHTCAGSLCALETQRNLIPASLLCPAGISHTTLQAEGFHVPFNSFQIQLECKPSQLHSLRTRSSSCQYSNQGGLAVHRVSYVSRRSKITLSSDVIQHVHQRAQARDDFFGVNSVQQLLAQLDRVGSIRFGSSRGM